MLGKCQSCVKWLCNWGQRFGFARFIWEICCMNERIQRGVLLMGLLVAIFSEGMIAQTAMPITWKTLSDVTFYEKYNKEFDFNVLYPKFGAKVKALDNKWVEIEGYAIPIEELCADILVLSALPYSQCFFCGAAGPESVMDIKSKKKIKAKLDKKLKFRGKLKLNEDDLSQLNYILTEAELIN